MALYTEAIILILMSHCQAVKYIVLHRAYFLVFGTTIQKKRSLTDVLCHSLSLYNA